MAKLNLDDLIKRLKEQHPYITMDTSTYIDTQNKCKFSDDKYGVFWTEPSKLKTGYGHPLRGKEIWTSKRGVKVEDLEKEIQTTRPFISIKYETFIDMRHKCTFIDSEFGPWTTYPWNVRKGCNNPKRGGRDNGIEHRLSIEEVQARLTIINPKLSIIKDTYTNTRSKCMVVHSEYGEWETNVSNILTHGYDHPKANCTGYIVSDEIKDWLESLKVSVKRNNRSWGFGSRELDFIVDGKYAIEYCGLYWHTEKALSGHWDDPKNAHYTKMLQANKHGYRLFTILEDEWLDRKEQVKGFIKSVLVPAPNKIAARKCTIVDLDNTTANNFYDANHIQGRSRGSLKHAGLTYNNELVAVMTIGAHHRQKRSEAVLTRLAIKSDYAIIGGSSKLLKYLLAYCKEQGYDKLTSWSDNRWSEGGVYKALGFTLEEELRPDYSYVKDKQRFSKQSLKKTAADRLTGKTEIQLRTEEGYSRIWDCGKKRWTMEISPGLVTISTGALSLLTAS